MDLARNSLYIESIANLRRGAPVYNQQYEDELIRTDLRHQEEVNAYDEEIEKLRQLNWIFASRYAVVIGIDDMYETLIDDTQDGIIDTAISHVRTLFNNPQIFIDLIQNNTSDIKKVLGKKNTTVPSRIYRLNGVHIEFFNVNAFTQDMRARLDAEDFEVDLFDGNPLATPLANIFGLPDTMNESFFDANESL